MIPVAIFEDNKDDGYFIDRALKGKIKEKYEIFPDPDLFLRSITMDTGVCIIDYKIEGDGRTGIDLMLEVFKINRLCKVIMMSVEVKSEDFMRSTQYGAFRILDKMSKYFEVDLVNYIRAAFGRLAIEKEIIGD